MNTEPTQPSQPPLPLSGEEPETQFALIWQIVIGALVAFTAYTGVFVAGMFDVQINPIVWIAMAAVGLVCIIVCLRRGLRGVIAGMALGGFATYLGYKFLGNP